MSRSVLATCADLVTFVVMLGLLGPASEANPIVHAAVVAGALGLVIAAKVAVVVVLATWPRAVARYGRSVATTGAAVGIVGAGTNVAALVGSFSR